METMQDNNESSHKTFNTLIILTREKYALVIAWFQVQ